MSEEQQAYYGTYRAVPVNDPRYASMYQEVSQHNAQVASNYNQQKQEAQIQNSAVAQVPGASSGGAVAGTPPTSNPQPFVGPPAPGRTIESYNQPQQQTQPQPVVPPTLFNIITNPLGVAKTLITPVGKVVAIDTQSPLGKFANYEVGAAGEVLNQHTQVGNAMGAVVGAKPTESAYTPQNDIQKNAGTVTRIGEATEVAIFAPILGPALGVSSSSVVLGEVASLGINTGMKAYSGGGLPTAEEAVVSLAEGGAFAIVGGKIIEVAGIGGKGVLPVIERVGVNTGLGASAGVAQEAYSTGKITEQGAIQGAAYGFAFGAIGEVAGYAGGKINAKYDVVGKVERNVPVPKYGEVIIPLEDGGVATYKGFYISRGSEAQSLLGRMSMIREGASIDAGYVPKSNIEARLTQDVMGKAGYSPETLQAVVDVREVMRTTQNTRPKTVGDVFPERTNTLSETGTSAVKEFIVSNKSQVDLVYGSYATKPQLSQEFEYTIGNVSALRTPGDIDIQLNVGQPKAELFAANLVEKLRFAGEDVRVSPEKPTLIEANVGGGKYAHAVDIHFKGEVVDVTTPTTEGAWGFKFAKQPVTIEKLPAMALNEQGLRKGSSILGFEGEQRIGPDYRVKDIPDFFQAQRTLLDTMPSDKVVSAKEAFNRAADYYGVDDLMSSKFPVSESPSFVYSPNTRSSSLATKLGLSLPSYNPLANIQEQRNQSPSLPSRQLSRAKVYPSSVAYSSSAFGDVSSLLYDVPSSPVKGSSSSRQSVNSSPLSKSYSPPSTPYYPIFDTTSPPPPYPSSPIKSGSSKLYLPNFNGSQFTLGSGLSRKKPDKWYSWGITEYPVVTAEEILGGKRKR